MRPDNRDNKQIRPTKITTNYLKTASSSVLIEFGDTKVICAATFNDKQPPFLMGTNKGWVTAEYSLLPFSTSERNRRERGKISGRTQEIQRLIGRSLRAVVDLNKLGPISIILDCDVLQADGGTRTASITGAFVSLRILINDLLEKGVIKEDPIIDTISAISTGIRNGEVISDLDYIEDSSAEVDMNFVITGKGGIVEVQGTAEGNPFSKNDLDKMYDFAFESCNELKEKQKLAIN